MTGLVQTWLNQSDACEVEVNGQRVRPMIMVAAEGGGIRAAYWTVKGLAAIDRETDGCGAHSTLFSGGASGGSVGLTVARFSGTPSDPGTAQAVDAVRAMAEPETLGQAVIGTFLRDPAYAATGVPLGTNGVAPAGSWADRARLIELGWNDASAGRPWGTSDFLADPATLSPATGPLVLNSSSVASQCRTWVSQLDLEQPTPPAAGTTGEQRCDRRVGPGARTIDLFAAYGPVGGTGPDCLRSVTASTAALLTARFPFVTPGGVVGGCDTRSDDGSSFWPRTQLIDGGYIENTGLATITDLSAQWLAQVRTHNDDVVAGRTTEPLIIPFVVFLTNQQATAGRLTPPPALQSELLLPAVGYLAGLGDADPHRCSAATGLDDRPHPLDLSPVERWPDRLRRDRRRLPAAGDRRRPDGPAGGHRAAGLGSVAGQHDRTGSRHAGPGEHHLRNGAHHPLVPARLRHPRRSARLPAVSVVALD